MGLSLVVALFVAGAAVVVGDGAVVVGVFLVVGDDVVMGVLVDAGLAVVPASLPSFPSLLLSLLLLLLPLLPRCFNVVVGLGVLPELLLPPEPRRPPASLR